MVYIPANETAHRGWRQAKKATTKVAFMVFTTNAEMDAVGMSVMYPSTNSQAMHLI
jgi:hypothetical protein